MSRATGATPGLGSQASDRKWPLCRRKCHEQVFLRSFAVGNARQLQLHGANAVDYEIMECAKRKRSATLVQFDVVYRLESCSVSGGGEWTLTLSGGV